MNGLSENYNWKKRLFLLVLCLLMGLTAGCRQYDRISAPSGKAGGADSSESEYEIYHQGSSQARESFEELCGQLFREQLSSSFLTLHYTLLNPEDYGITDYEKSFGDFSLDNMRAERQKQKALHSAFAQIDPELLDQEQQLTYRILMEAFEAEDTGDGLELYYQPLAPSTGIQAQLPVILGEFTLRNRRDIEDYLTLLDNIDEYYQQILDFEKQKSQAGFFMTDACVDQITAECEAYLLPAEHNFMTTIFNQQLENIEDLTEEEKADYRDRNQTIVAESFIPAYQLLISGLQELKGTCLNDQGLCYYPDGAAYYEYLVRSSVGTTYETIEELQEAISRQVNDDLTAMSQILKEHPETAEQIENYQFSLTDPNEILNHLRDQITEDFPECPECHYVTKTVPEDLAHTLGPAFFLVPPIDDYDHCIIYINPDSTTSLQPLYSTLAHEGIPGHMYQNAYFHSRCTSDIRRVLSFISYSEGWAFYVENYSYTTDNGLSPELGRLLAHNAAASLGIHALMDININYFGWTRQQVREFLNPYFSSDSGEEGDVAEAVYNTMLNSPVDYLNYYVGYLEILNMRDQAMETLGDRFELKKFHEFLLDIGPAPFTVINDEFHVWLMTYGLQS